MRGRNRDVASIAKNDPGKTWDFTLFMRKWFWTWRDITARRLGLSLASSHNPDS
ncbi:hypothetical protein CERZMDRAFT_96739 [Cercospora zeae-maydis SCOH1-5]|uniref:Uncharacterized protein n=1 Tax=Cercospora zeae-maydis SCOH1-5 TaxID=717836 RepID=A0A6A6FIL1_9PEZI|nr:hypothetical protein CERZMDRAFT_96739 [Cercospora zeae-maydis SCOH1-5]